MKKVYIIHGWTYNLDKWANFSAALKARGIDPILLKVPGLTEPSDKVWDINGYEDWLNDQIKTETKPIVIGHSNGGRIALSYVQKYPGRISQLILIDSAGIAHNEARSIIKLKILKFLSKVGKVLSLLPPVKKLFYRVIGAQDYYNAPPNMRLTMQNMLRADQQLDLSQIKLPVTIIWGQDDTVTPLSDGQKMQALINGSSLQIIRGGRHAPFNSQPDEVAEIVAEVLKDQP